MHYYQFNIGDYAKATRHLSNNEDLAYRRLIELYYDTEKPLINDIKKLSRLINMRENEQDIEVVLDDFFIESENGYTQNRIEREIDSYHSKADKARANGKLGGRPKKPDAKLKEPNPKPKITQPVNSANPDLTGLKANQEPLTNNHKPITINKEPVTSLKEISQPKVETVNQQMLDDVFNYWRLTTGKAGNVILNEKRKKAVKARMKEGYSVEDIKQAILGCTMTPHNMGDNDNRKVYDDLELICRDGSQLERFMGNSQQQAATFSRAAQKTINNIMNVELD